MRDVCRAGDAPGHDVLRTEGRDDIDFALFMIEVLTNDELVHEAPAIVGRRTRSALAHVAAEEANDAAVR